MKIYVIYKFKTWTYLNIPYSNHPQTSHLIPALIDCTHLIFQLFYNKTLITRYAQHIRVALAINSRKTTLYFCIRRPRQANGQLVTMIQMENWNRHRFASRSLNLFSAACVQFYCTLACSIATVNISNRWAVCRRLCHRCGYPRPFSYRCGFCDFWLIAACGRDDGSFVLNRRFLRMNPYCEICDLYICIFF